MCGSKFACTGHSKWKRVIEKGREGRKRNGWWGGERVKNRVRARQREASHMSMSGSCLPSRLTTTEAISRRWVCQRWWNAVSLTHTLPLSLSHSLCLSVGLSCVCVCVCALCTCKDSLRTMQRRDIALSARTRTGLGRGYGSVEVSVRSLAQAQTEFVFSSACLCICSLGPACESSNFLNSPPLTVSRPSATLSLGRVVAVCV